MEISWDLGSLQPDMESVNVITCGLGDFPDDPVVKILPVQGAWVQSLVGELRSHMLHGVAKKKKKKRKSKSMWFWAHHLKFFLV